MAQIGSNLDAARFSLWTVGTRVSGLMSNKWFADWLMETNCFRWEDAFGRPKKIYRWPLIGSTTCVSNRTVRVPFSTGSARWIVDSFSIFWWSNIKQYSLLHLISILVDGAPYRSQKSRWSFWRVTFTRVFDVVTQGFTACGVGWSFSRNGSRICYCGSGWRWLVEARGIVLEVE